MNRIRVSAIIDGDAVSPDSISAANEYLTHQIEERAEVLDLSINWNTWRSYSKPVNGKDLKITQWAKIMKVHGATKVFK